MAVDKQHSIHCKCHRGATSCGDWLARLRTERHLRLVHTRVRLDDSGVRVLLHILRQRGSSQAVEALVLEYAAIDALGIVALAQGLPSTTPRLRLLSLAGCGCDDTGVKALAQLVGSGTLPKLRSLALEDNPFSPAARYLMRTACRSRSVELSAYSEVENESLYLFNLGR